MKTLKALLEARKALVAKEAALLDAEAFGDEERAQLDAVQKELEVSAADIERAKRAETRTTQPLGIADDGPVITGVRDLEAEKPFRSFGEQLQAIRSAGTPNGAVDKRLMRIHDEARAASGANEAIPSDGGYLVQKDFSAEILQEVHDASPITAKCKHVPVQGNGLVFNGVDETSRVDGSRWGGVVVYWRDEAALLTSSAPSFRRVEMTLNKLTGLFYATDELIADAPALGNIAQTAFTEEMNFRVADAVIRGDGAGKPKGFLSSGALVTVAKENNQAADTVVAENIIKMRARLGAKYRGNAAWYVNQEVETQLPLMNIAVGTAGIPVYMPAGGLSGAPYDTLYGMPVIPIEHASALGDVGDIVLADLGQYIIIDKGGIDSAESMHVRFLYDEMTYRWVLRIDGQTIRNSPITPYKGGSSSTQSAFVALAAR